MTALSAPDDRAAYFAARTTLLALGNYRCALYAAQQAGVMPPAPPALTAAQMVDAYGVAMHEPGQRYVTFAEWHALQTTPQPTRRYGVAGTVVQFE